MLITCVVQIRVEESDYISPVYSAEGRSSGEIGCDDRIGSLRTVEMIRLYGADPTTRECGVPPALFSNKRFTPRTPSSKVRP
jgi:hypothetical protein